MKQFYLIFLLITSLAVIGQESITDQLIIHYKQSSNKKLIHSKNNATSQVLKKFNAKEIAQKHNPQNLSVIKIPKTENIHDVLQEVSQLEDVELVELDHLQYGAGKLAYIPNDSFYNRQWSFSNDGTFSLAPAKAGADIKMQQAWDIEKGNENTIVAVIDTGCRLDHPDLLGRYWLNPNEIDSNGIDDDHNGYIDDIYGWDFVNNTNTPADDHGHGTNIAGIIGANTNNSIGYSGINMFCKIMNLKALNKDNTGFTSDIINALYYAANNGAKVINMSLGGGHTVAYETAINSVINQGITVVAGMMNDNNNVKKYPAGYNNVIAVGSTDPDDKRSAPFFWSETSGSSYGDHISVVAPGNYIFSLNNQVPETYNHYWGGTSQATPHVVGLATLLLAQNPSLTPIEIKNIIETTADDQVGNPTEDLPGFDIYYGHGRINALRALSNNLSVSELNDITRTATKIYPNPASDIIHIDLSANQKTPTTVTFYNLQGAIVWQTTIHNLSNEIPIPLSEGLYILEINGNTYKIIIQL